ncbi:MAG: hypothetical protein ACJ74O_17315 [Frankiaceae bacterium]
MLLLRVTIGDEPGEPALALRRAAVAADALRRLAELRGTRTALALDAPGDGLVPTLADLNVLPAGDLPAAPHRAADVEVVAGRPPAGGGEEQQPRRRLVMGAVDAPGALDLAALDDPLALRLALLAEPAPEPVRLTEAGLAGVAGRLRRWRAVVATAAESPSAPVAGPYVDRVIAALADGLDGPAVLAALDALVADRSLRPGAVFETLALLDRVLALDLVRDVGRAPGS